MEPLRSAVTSSLSPLSRDSGLNYPKRDIVETARRNARFYGSGRFVVDDDEAVFGHLDGILKHFILTGYCEYGPTLLI
jgi:hypothetical protein